MLQQWMAVLSLSTHAVLDVIDNDVTKRISTTRRTPPFRFNKAASDHAALSASRHVCPRHFQRIFTTALSSCFPDAFHRMPSAAFQAKNRSCFYCHKTNSLTTQFDFTSSQIKLEPHVLCITIYKYFKNEWSVLHRNVKRLPQIF